MVKRLEIDTPHHTRVKSIWTGITVGLIFILILAGLLIFMESQLISFTPVRAVVNVIEEEEEICSPRIRNASIIEYHSGHRYYSLLKAMDPPVPTFRKAHTVLCDEDARAHTGFSYCLPITARKDTPYCTAADRSDLLHTRSRKSICYASVLHLLLVEVYEELQATGNIPLVVFGSLLGAVRNGAMIPFTEDTDIGFVGKLNAKEVLQQELWNKGYHLFFQGVWRVCVAPTHPLAGLLYDPDRWLTRYIGVPYVDLYRMQNLNNGNWDVEELKSSTGSILPAVKVEPFSQVTINGMPFDTVHDPKFFLIKVYGPNYMTPRRRGSLSTTSLSAKTNNMHPHADKGLN
ncbi:hypothetical protein DVH05_020641 [Phytophthora capsici]|nr:hypothetical protein DVH05_020641 [Phytophthora capsici]